MQEPLRRRERLRQATVAEIKELAWGQLAKAGPASLSLRAIARDMGMTSSAIYRYFASRDELLTALATDGFASLADDLEAAEAKAVQKTADCHERWMRVARAHRTWALSHPTEFALLYDTPGFHPDPDNSPARAEMVRAVAVLFRVMIDGLQRGEFDTKKFAATTSRRLRTQFEAWELSRNIGLPPEAVGGCMFAWTHLHGAISLELFGQYPEELLPADDLFDQQMRHVLQALSKTRKT
ncbi:MAG: TetR/AcrR family transcriptional regulator [Acidimicrobiaceae bacterium]|nr:TetR/AcrR family transcriptional regulator [Acidimicrobiaceae bacterium]